MDAQTQTAPGTGRRGSDNISISTARGFYHGITPPPSAPAARDPLTIAGEMHQAAECLADLAEDFAAGVYDARALSSADALLIGCGRLVCELRQRREAQS